MNQKFQQLYELLCKKDVPPFKFIQELELAGDFSDDLFEAMKVRYIEKNWEIMPALIASVHLVPSSKFTQLLCDLLDNYRNETFIYDLATLAIDIRDPQMVPSLIRALNHRVNGDADYHFNRNILAALNVINTPEAIEGIKLAVQSSYMPLREEAEEYLQERNLL